MSECSSSQCFCSNTYGNYGNYLTNDTDCGAKCKGNSSQFCGGTSRNSIIKIKGINSNCHINFTAY